MPLFPKDFDKWKGIEIVFLNKQLVGVSCLGKITGNPIDAEKFLSGFLTYLPEIS